MKNESQPTNQCLRPRWALALAALAGAFGLLTVKAGGEVLFIDGVGRQAAGNYVSFVLWFNFAAGFAYIAAAVGIGFWRPWAISLSAVIGGSTLMVFGALWLWIMLGEPYETRTLAAMTLRSVVWVGIYLVLKRRMYGADGKT